MSLAGPRLDRPSAIGDEGRPRGVSLWLATIAVVLATVAGGLTLGDPGLVSALAPLVGLAVAGMALTERPRYGQLVVGHALTVGFGSVFGLLVVASPLLGREAIATAGFALAIFGIAMAWADVDLEGVKRTGVGCGLTYATIVVGAALAVLAGLAIAVAVSVLGAIVATDAPAGSVAGVLGLAVTVAVAGLFAITMLPIEQLTRRSRRVAVGRRLEIVRRALGAVVFAGLCGLFLLGLLWLSGLFEWVVGRFSLLEQALVALSAGVVVWPLVGIAAGVIGLTVLVRSARLVTRRNVGRASSRTWTSALTVALAVSLAGAVAVALGALGVAAGNPGPGGAILTLAGAGVVLIGLGPPAFLLVLGTILVGVWLTLLPERALAPALASVGLVVAAIALASSGPLVAVGCIGVALFVWDCGTYGVGLTAELGHRPQTRRLELVHGLLSLGVAVGAVALVAGLAALLSIVGTGLASPIALVLATVGAIVLLLPIRG